MVVVVGQVREVGMQAVPGVLAGAHPLQSLRSKVILPIFRASVYGGGHPPRLLHGDFLLVEVAIRVVVARQAPQGPRWRCTGSMHEEEGH